jgi:hypothetical protein
MSLFIAKHCPMMRINFEEPRIKIIGAREHGLP